MYRLVGKADAKDAYVHVKDDALHFSLRKEDSDRVGSRRSQYYNVCNTFTSHINTHTNTRCQSVTYHLPYSLSFQSIKCCC